MIFKINFALSQCLQDYCNPFLMDLGPKPTLKLLLSPKLLSSFFKNLKSHQLNNLIHIAKYLEVIQLLFVTIRETKYDIGTALKMQERR